MNMKVMRHIGAFAVGCAAVVVAVAIWTPPAYAGRIHVEAARIGCFNIHHYQEKFNLTRFVKRACDGKYTCHYSAPTPGEYRAEGVHASHAIGCTQAMEIIYDCGSSHQKRMSVPGNAWKQPPAVLRCEPSRQLPTIGQTTQGRLHGFVDLHTHPMANLAFGGKLLFGGLDVGWRMPIVWPCRQSSRHHSARARSIEDALGWESDRATHGGVNVDPLHARHKNPCADRIRQLVIRTMESTFTRFSRPDARAPLSTSGLSRISRLACVG